jgi:hypothetical protein
LRVALLASAIFLAAAALIALRSRNATATDMTTPQPVGADASVLAPLGVEA